MHHSLKLVPGLAFATATVYVAALVTIQGMGLVDGLRGLPPGTNPLVSHPFAYAGMLCALSLGGALLALAHGSNQNPRGRG